MSQKSGHLLFVYTIHINQFYKASRASMLMTLFPLRTQDPTGVSSALLLGLTWTQSSKVRFKKTSYPVKRPSIWRPAFILTEILWWRYFFSSGVEMTICRKTRCDDSRTESLKFDLCAKAHQRRCRMLKVVFLNVFFHFSFSSTCGITNWDWHTDYLAAVDSSAYGY